MVIAGHHQHAAVRRAAIHVAVLDGVARPVDAGSLAVPEPEDPVHGRRWLLFRLLRAGHDGGGHILVHGRQEIDLVAVEMPVGAPQLDIEGGERRAAIARYQPAGGQPRRRVEACLVQQHAHQRLCSGHEDAAGSLGVSAVQRWRSGRAGGVARRGGREGLCVVRCHQLSLRAGEAQRTITFTLRQSTLPGKRAAGCLRQSIGRAFRLRFGRLD